MKETNSQLPIFLPISIRKKSGDEWETTGPAPALSFEKNLSLSGWYRIRFKYQTDFATQRNPVLSYVVDGVTVRIRLDRSRSGKIDHVVNLPPLAIEVSLELLGARGPFMLSSVEFVPLSQIRSMQVIIFRALGNLRSGGGRSRRRVVLVVLRYLKQHGIQALKTRLIQAYHQGAGEELLAGKRLSTFNDLRQEWELNPDDLARMSDDIKGMSTPPTISVIMPVFNTEEKWLRAAIESVLCQTYPYWQLCIANDASTEDWVIEVLDSYEKMDTRIQVVHRKENGHISMASNSALGLAVGQWVAMLDHDDELHAAALYCLAEQIVKYPEVRFVYTDEDKIDEVGTHSEPHFKPEFNHGLLLSQNYISHLSVIEIGLLKEIGGFRAGYEGAQDYDLFLRCIENLTLDQIAHIPIPLYSWRMAIGSTAADPLAKDYAERAGTRALVDHLDRVGVRAKVLTGRAPTTYRVKYDLPTDPPLVSVIIPTRNGLKHLRKCLSSFETFVRYPNYEILIVDNDSDDEETVGFLREQEQNDQIKVLDYPGEFNYSAINNAGVRATKGDIICLLNDDTEAIVEGWLTEMVSQLLQPEVGVVGAKLLYEDRSIQHAGIILGMGGIAGHGHKNAEKNALGYFYRLQVAHDVGAVTGACLVTSRDLWEQLEGLDEKRFKVAFNDVDFCLRVREGGQRVLWTPYAELVHYESKSRGLDVTPEKMERLRNETIGMRDKWGKALSRDPAYSPNLSLDTERFEYSDRPRYFPPWRRPVSQSRCP